MYDMLPFPNITATTVEGLTAQMNNYLVQFKETLEFVLTNISIENLSPALMDKLNSLGVEVEKTTEEATEQIQQVSNKVITVLDVINSDAFNDAVDSAVPKQYLVSAEQVQTSQVSGGINIYAIKDASGEVSQFTVRNGDKGDTGAKGPQGDKGDTGEQGIQGIQGEKGEKGEAGVQGEKGDTGADGKSAYEIALANGYTTAATESEWLESLKGDKGDQGIQGEKGVQGIQGEQGVQGEKGEKGDKGDKGEPGTTPNVTFSVNFNTGNLEYTTS